jgi:hypothetical protein
MGEPVKTEGPPLPFDKLRTRLTLRPTTVLMLSLSKHAELKPA